MPGSRSSSRSGSTAGSSRGRRRPRPTSANETTTTTPPDQTDTATDVGQDPRRRHSHDTQLQQHLQQYAHIPSADQSQQPHFARPRSSNRSTSSSSSSNLVAGPKISSLSMGGGDTPAEPATAHSTLAGTFDRLTPTSHRSSSGDFYDNDTSGNGGTSSGSGGSNGTGGSIHSSSFNYGGGGGGGTGTSQSGGDETRSLSGFSIPHPSTTPSSFAPYLSATAVGSVGSGRDDRSLFLDAHQQHHPVSPRAMYPDIHSRSLYSGALIPTIHDNDNTNNAMSSLDADLRHVYTALDLSPIAVRRLTEEGIRTMEDLSDVAPSLRNESSTASSLPSVATARLRQYFEWSDAFRIRHYGMSPEVQTDFSADVHRTYREQQQRASSISYTWPQLGVANDRSRTTSPLLIPVTYTYLLYPNHSDTGDPDSHNSNEDEGDSNAEQPHPQSPMSPQSTTPNPDSLRDWFRHAERSYRDFHAVHRQRNPANLKQAMDSYRRVVNAPPQSEVECMLQAFACIKLAILLHRRDCINLHEAMELLRRASQDAQVPTAHFLYGHALLTGHGGVVPDEPRGRALLHEAAAAGIAEAQYCLGSVHEQLGDNKATAQRHYELCVYLARQRPSQLMDDTDARSTQSSVVHETNEFWKADLAAAMRLHTPGSAYNTHADRHTFSRTIGRANWIFLGHALLLIAAAVASPATDPSHYPALLPLLPMVGVILSVVNLAQLWSASSLGNATWRANHQFHRAKLQAYKAILHVSIPGCWFLPVISLLFLWYYQISLWSVETLDQHRLGTEAQRDRLEGILLWLHAWRAVHRHAFWSRFHEWSLLLLGLCLLVGWSHLLYQESSSYVEGCSDWWETTCQGADAFCNEQKTRLETCNLNGELDFSTYNFRLVPTDLQFVSEADVR